MDESFSIIRYKADVYCQSFAFDRFPHPRATSDWYAGHASTILYISARASRLDRDLYFILSDSTGNLIILDLQCIYTQWDDLDNWYSVVDRNI